jgi:molecular chaperone GrpE
LEEQETQTESSAGEQAAPDAAEAADKAADSAVKELAETKDKYIRLMAEFDNFRRRTAKENFELIASANQKLIGKLTEVLDNFELAFDPKNRSNAEEFEKGIKLIQSKFKNILSDEGLEELPAAGEFDPNLHDALMQQPSDTVPENHIVQTLQKGWKVKGKVIRHAKVIVSTGKA